MTQLSPIEWAKQPIQKYADFSGRAPRAEYWWYTLALVVAYFVLSTVESIVGLEAMFALYGPLTLLLMLATLVPGLAVTARRLHDTSRSGWWMLIAIVPYAIMTIAAGGAAATGSMASLGMAGLIGIVAFCGAIALLVFLVLPGTKGSNRFGPDPYGGDSEAPVTA